MVYLFNINLHLRRSSLACKIRLLIRHKSSVYSKRACDRSNLPELKNLTFNFSHVAQTSSTISWNAMLKSVGPSLNPYLTLLSIQNTSLESFMWLSGTSRCYQKQLAMFRGSFSLHSLVKFVGMSNESKTFL